MSASINTVKHVGVMEPFWGTFVRTAVSQLENWLPDMDLNHDKQIQSLLCYRYTIGQSVQAQRLGIRG